MGFDKFLDYVIVRIFLLFCLGLPGTAVSDEGYSSPELAMPASVYYRAFTVDTQRSACQASPEVFSIRLRVPKKIMYVGDKLRVNSPDDSTVSDLIIEAFDRTGGFVTEVPVNVSVYSIGLTDSVDPRVIYRDASMNYWEARKPGEFAVSVRWLCPDFGKKSVADEVIIRVVDPEQEQ